MTESIKNEQSKMSWDMDWAWWYLDVVRDSFRYALVFIAVQCVWMFTGRVKLRRRRQKLVKAQEKLELATRGQGCTEMNNNTITTSTTTAAGKELRVMCHKSTQWEAQADNSAQRQQRGGPTIRYGGLKQSPLSAQNKEPIISKVLVKRGSADEGLTAQKIKQLMANTSTRVSDKKIHAQPALKAINGHVNDLKMRFEDGEKELKPFQRAVDSVTMMNRFASMLPPSQLESPVPSNGGKVAQEEEEEQCLNVSTEDDLETTVVVMRSRKPRTAAEDGRRFGNKFSLPEGFGGSVHSLEDILNQQRFSRSLSQYSVSDLCWNESPAEINRNCERFDELFSQHQQHRSMEDLRRLNDWECEDRNNCELAKFVSMDVVNV